MKKHSCATIWLAALAGGLALLAVACEGLNRVVVTASDIVEKNPQLIKDEKTRATVVSGARAARSLVTDIDTAQEIEMGQSLAVRAFASFGQPYPDEALQDYVAKVGKLVALQSDRPTMPYSFAVVASDQPNALALPGGFIFVSTGLLKRLGSESELACVLGHEVSHVALKHGIEVVARDQRIANLVDFGQQLDEKVKEYRQFIDLAYTKLTTEGYDRRYETMADEAGTRYAWRAGYNPEGLLPFLRASASGGNAMQFEVFKTHPDSATRIDDIRSVLRSLGDYSGMPKLEDRYGREVLTKLR